jgi:predicted enzyme related to lactoylglutathione lyase
VDVMKEQFGDVSFGLIDHEDGNGGCLVERPEEVSATGLLVYMNAEGRIRDAVAMAVEHGGSIVEDLQSIGPHGFRAVVLDSEGNRIALHSTTDE